jgi:hypothetical protein
VAPVREQCGLITPPLTSASAMVPAPTSPPADCHLLRVGGTAQPLASDGSRSRSWSSCSTCSHEPLRTADPTQGWGCAPLQLICLLTAATVWPDRSMIMDNDQKSSLEEIKRQRAKVVELRAAAEAENRRRLRYPSLRAQRRIGAARLRLSVTFGRRPTCCTPLSCSISTNTALLRRRIADRRETIRTAGEVGVAGRHAAPYRPPGSRRGERTPNDGWLRT